MGRSAVVLHRELVDVDPGQPSGERLGTHRRSCRSYPAPAPACAPRSGRRSARRAPTAACAARHPSPPGRRRSGGSPSGNRKACVSNGSAAGRRNSKPAKGSPWRASASSSLRCGMNGSPQNSGAASAQCLRRPGLAVYSRIGMIWIEPAEEIERCVSGSKARSDSSWSPKNSSRIGMVQVRGKYVQDTASDRKFPGLGDRIVLHVPRLAQEFPRQFRGVIVALFEFQAIGEETPGRVHPYCCGASRRDHDQRLDPAASGTWHAPAPRRSPGEARGRGRGRLRDRGGVSRVAAKRSAVPAGNPDPVRDSGRRHP